MNADGETPSLWAIRLTSRANADIVTASSYFAVNAGIEIARVWAEGLDAEISKLARFPTIWPIAEEDKLFQETVRRMLYRRTRTGPAYRVLFILRQNPDDAPTVVVIHVRHSAQAPMTQGEAWEIESSE